MVDMGETPDALPCEHSTTGRYPDCWVQPVNMSGRYPRQTIILNYGENSHAEAEKRSTEDNHCKEVP